MKTGPAFCVWNSFMLQAGEDKIVAAKLGQIFRSAKTAPN